MRDDPAPEIISYKSFQSETSGRLVWFVTHNGRVLGDSRGYSTRDEAHDAAIKAVEKAPQASPGVRSAVYRPGF